MWLGDKQRRFRHNNNNSEIQQFFPRSVPSSTSAASNNNKISPYGSFFSTSRSLLSTRTQKPIEMINLEETKRSEGDEIVQRLCTCFTDQNSATRNNEEEQREQCESTLSHNVMLHYTLSPLFDMCEPIMRNNKHMCHLRDGRERQLIIH